MYSRLYYEKNLSYVKRIILDKNKSIFLNLIEIYNPMKWTVSPSDMEQLPLPDKFQDIFNQYFTDFKNTFVDVDHDMLGQRSYVSLEEVF